MNARLKKTLVGVDVANADDHIGTGFIRLGKQPHMEAWTLDEWIDLMSMDSKISGQVRVVSSWAPQIKMPERPMRGTMRAVVYEATDLKAGDAFGRHGGVVRPSIDGAVPPRRRAQSSARAAGVAASAASSCPAPCCHPGKSRYSQYCTPQPVSYTHLTLPTNREV